MVPAFDPEARARDIENGMNRDTVSPPFDPSSYALSVEEPSPSTTQSVRSSYPTPHTFIEVPLSLAADPSEDRTSPGIGGPCPPSSAPASSIESDETIDGTNIETIGREMYGSYLASDFPEALVLAERVLKDQPAHALAQLVAERCRERLHPTSGKLNPSSVLRLKFAELERQSRHIDPTSSYVLGHIDGVADAATVAALTGLPDHEALARLHALLDLGVLELVSA
jgi:hypothetical protein